MPLKLFSFFFPTSVENDTLDAFSGFQFILWRKKNTHDEKKKSETDFVV